MIPKKLIFEIEVFSEEDFKKVNELMKVKLSNLELTGLIKIKDLEPTEQ